MTPWSTTSIGRMTALTLALGLLAGFGAMIAAQSPVGAQDSPGRPPAPDLTGPLTFTVVGTAADGLSTPRDLAFHPDRPGELWTVNRATDGTVIYFDAGTEQQRVEARVDRYANHFMEEVSSLAFGAADTFATCQESRNTYNDRRPPNDFMGPTLWPADLDIYANVNQGRAASDPAGVEKGAYRSSREGQEVGGAASARSDSAGPNAAQLPAEWADVQTGGLLCHLPATDRLGRRPAQGTLGSHLDMNHESPLCMGIAHDEANVYWVIDGHNGNVVAYDFVEDHGPGGDDHSDAVLRRFTEAPFTRLPDVPSHAVLDHETGWLYYADTGEGVVRRLDTRGGQKSGDLRVSEERIAEYAEWRGAAVEVFLADLDEPAGLALAGDQLLVSEHATGEIAAYDLATGAEVGRIETGSEGLMGIEVASDGRLWYVDGAANQLVRVDPETVPTSTDTIPGRTPTSSTSPTATVTEVVPTTVPTDEPSATPSLAPPTMTPSPWRRIYVPLVSR